MPKIKIETTQNVSFDFELCGLGDRVLAGILDLLFMIAYVIVLLLFFGMTGLFQVIGSSPTIFMVLGAPLFFYHILFEVFTNGQSPGKKIMKIRVIKLDGSMPDINDYLLRWIFGNIDFLMMHVPAIVSILVTKKEQRLGDIAAGTTVIKLKKRATLADTLLHFIEKNYQPTFKNVMLLSDKDLNIIKETLQYFERTRDEKTLKILADKTKEILKSDSGLGPYSLLKTVIKDYNYLSKDLVS